MRLPPRNCSNCLAVLFMIVGSTLVAEETPQGDEAISYYRQIRPIFQAHCAGCHQPAKAGGEYVMTTFERLLKGGESETAAIVAGKPDESQLLELITPTDGKAEMPKGKAALAEADIALIRQWIAAGAVDDTPESAKQKYDMEHPPVYTQAPVITAIDYSPDGQLLAVSGFHEVLVVKADGSELVARLVGLSARIETVQFSPDGTRLAVTGGLPGRTGEVQVWDVAKKELVLSVPMTFDTLRGGRWSPDGTKICFGCADNSVRAIDATTGEQVLFQGAHSDWVRDTVFSTDGSHIVSVSRDMTAKLTEVATERFVDNVTSITPGALKGGMICIARHPTRDEIVIGGADGVAKVYRMQRLTKRVIGDDANLIRKMPSITGRIFSVDVSADGTRIVAGASLDGVGHVQVYTYEFDTNLPGDIKKINEKVVTSRSSDERKRLNEYHATGVQKIAEATIAESSVYAVDFRPDGKAVAVAGTDGRIRILDATNGELLSEFSPAPVQIVAENEQGQDAVASADFIQDVAPVLSRLGCNAGTCHGAAKGKNGFKLSLRGYDHIFDVRALTDDLASRRVNYAAPDASLMLLKATSAVPHVGGQLIKPDDDYYKIIRSWIAGGAKLNQESPRVVSISVTPLNPVVEAIGGEQPMEVVATYSDGSTRKVTQEAFIETGNGEVATLNRRGVATTLRRGEAPILARYEGAYAATTLTSMGDRRGFVWEAPPTWGRIDELVADKWQRVKTLPSDLCTNAEFLRRVYLDLTGLPPTVEQVRAFLADPRETRVKRDAIIDELIGSEAYIEYWTNKWADMLEVNRKFLGAEGAAAFRKWIRDEVAANTPYDELARKILTASGSNRENPAASYFKVFRNPVDTMENTTHLFLGVRFNCNKCHDHPFERWTQDQYYETAAYFAQFALERDPESGKRRIGGTAVEGAKPFYEIVVDKTEGEVIHDRTKAVTAPQFPFDAEHTAPEGATRRQQLAAWMTHPTNAYFAKSYVNRVWGYLLGVGIIEPIDDIRAGNPPSNPELLDFLTKEFIDHKFDVQHVQRLICKSRVYQLSVASNDWNEDDRINYSHAMARRLPAEVLYDTIHRVTGAVSNIPGVPAGTRAAAIPDSGIDLPSGFLTTFGRPVRESSCECERSNDMQLGPVMALISGPTVARAVGASENGIAQLANREDLDERSLINELFLRILNRPATKAEIDAAQKELKSIDADHERLQGTLAEREKFVAAQRPELERQRDERIAAATANRDTYKAELEPRRAEEMKKRAAKQAELEADLKKYEVETLQPKLAEWVAKQVASSRQWITIDPTELSSSTGAKLTKEEDLAIFVERKEGFPVYTIVATVDATKITGIQLEALADDRLPSRGPGLADNGNFVLTEFEVLAAPKSDPTQQKPVALHNAKADKSQGGYDIKTAIDGKRPRNNNGWAVGNGIGQSHWAVLETKEPVGFEGGTVLTFKLDHRFADKKHHLGKFRLSITEGEPPIELGLPAELATIVSVPEDQRNDDQKARLLKYYAERDGEWKKKAQAIAEAKKPLPADPKLAELEAAVKASQAPIPDDPTLVQLRRDAAMSNNQHANRRLTIAQDLTWVLLNSPEFLFNH